MSFQHLTIENMQLFVTVADSGSISAAAEQFFIDPSSVSRKITLMEEELSNQLFTRSTRGVSLTDSGNNFYKFCQETLANLSVLFDELSVKSELSQVKIGTYDSVSIGLYNNFFSKNFSKLGVVKISNQINELIKNFNNNQLNTLIIDHEFSKLLTGVFHEKPLVEEAFYLVSTQKLTDSFVRENWSQFELFLHPKNCPIHQKLLTICPTKNLPKIHEIEYTMSALAFLNSENQASLLPESSLKKISSDNLYFHKLPKKFNRKLSLVSRNLQVQDLFFKSK
jgi:DNA-binding transcriptional LysR family regulator